MELSLSCPHCSAQKVGFCVTAERRRLNNSKRFDMFAYCRACESPIIVEILSTSGQSSVMQHWDQYRDKFQIQKVHPCRATASAPEYTPPTIAKDFVEGLECLRRGSFNAAGMMFRKTLQRATTAIADGAGIEPFKSKMPLQHRIDALAKCGLLTESMRDLAVAIKLDGNAAAHEEEQEFDEAAATQTKDFVELFLLYTLSLPERVKRASPGAEFFC